MNKPTLSLAALALATLLATGCVTEEQSFGTGNVQIRDVSEDYQIVKVFAVTRGEERLGMVEQTLQRDGDFNDQNDRYVYVVRDQDGGMLGFVTDDSRAYRRKAHQDAAELVANLPTLEENTAAVYGFYDKKVTLTDLTYERRSD
jgi:hypothetical protein